MNDLTETGTMKKQARGLFPGARSQWKGTSWHFSLNKEQAEPAPHSGWKQVK